MVKLALLGERYPAQLRENPQGLKDVEVVWAGSRWEDCRVSVPGRKPDVLAVDVLEWGAQPAEQLQALLGETGARHAIVTYRFGRREAVMQHSLPRVRLVQGQLSLPLLRAHVHMAVLDEMLPTKPSKPAASPAAAQSLPPPRPPRFTPEQLGRLMEISSAVQCECPNQVSQLVNSLLSFEEYSKNCESRNEQDREVHAMLYRHTAAARAIMEDALQALIVHEKIQL